MRGEGCTSTVILSGFELRSTVIAKCGWTDWKDQSISSRDAGLSHRQAW
jgi:hypothetical protein